MSTDKLKRPKSRALEFQRATVIEEAESFQAREVGTTGVYAFRYRRDLLKDGKRFESLVQQGLVNRRDLPKSIETAKSVKTIPGYCLVSAKFRELLRTVGFAGMVSRGQEFRDEMTDKPFDDIEKFESSSVVRLDYSSHTAFEVSGKPVACAVWISSGCLPMDLSSRAFDLKQILPILKARQDVEILKSRYGEEITEEYYPDSDGCCRINIIWKPSDADFARYAEKCAEMAPNSSSSISRFYALRDLDIFGIEKLSLRHIRAASEGALSEVKDAIERFGVDIEARNALGTAFEAAAMHGQVDVLSYLLERGCVIRNWPIELSDDNDELDVSDADRLRYADMSKQITVIKTVEELLAKAAEDQLRRTLTASNQPTDSERLKRRQTAVRVAKTPSLSSAVLDGVVRTTEDLIALLSATSKSPVARL